MRFMVWTTGWIVALFSNTEVQKHAEEEKQELERWRNPGTDHQDGVLSVRFGAQDLD